MSSSTNISHVYLQLKDQIADLKKQATEQGKAYLTEAAKALFEKHPDLAAFQWHQYTPYFNDGDVCTFSAGDVNVRLISEGEDAEFEWRYGKEPGIEAQNDASALVASIGDEQLEEIFGNGVEITVDRNGTKIDEYEHD